MLYDVWLLGDQFLQEAYNEFLTWKSESEDKKSPMMPPIMIEFFNVKMWHKESCSENLAISRVINNLIEAVNEKKARLPKYLIVILDQDLCADVQGSEKVHQEMLQKITTWLVRQISVIICQKRVDLFEKCPGTLSGLSTKIIFVKMLCRIGKYHEQSNMFKTSVLRPKFNDALNDTVAKIDQYILTVNSCGAYEHYDSQG